MPACSIGGNSILRTMDSLRIACLHMDADADIEANCQQISAAIHAAAENGVDILLTPECALSGYPGAGRDDYQDINWCSYDGFEDLIHTRAQQAGIAVVLGTISMADGKLFNDALFCGNEANVTRYHKRCLTPFDKNFFTDANKACVVEFKGWQLGLCICFDVRFPHTWGDVVCAGADAVLSIAHMAGPDPDDNVKNTVVPQHYASRAAEWATPLVMCNTAHEKRWLDSGAWDPRGMRIDTERKNNLFIFDMKKRDAFDPWYSQIYQDAVSYHRRND